MSDETNNIGNDELPSELEILKKRATTLNIKFHPSIGVDTLRAKVTAALEAGPDAKAPSTIAAPVNVIKPIESIDARNKRLRTESAKLIRVRVTCMNPNKKEWEGEVFTVSNSVVGTFKKFVQFDADEGWHIPTIIYKHLKERQCQVFTTVKGPRGNKIRKGKLIKEFAIEVMDPLTGEELDALAQRQAMANNLG